MYRKAVWYLLVIIFLTSCKKEQDSLPEETHTGAYTMGFKIGSTNYSVQGKVGDLLECGAVSYDYEGGKSIFIRGQKTCDPKFEIWLTIQYNDTLGTYVLKDGEASGTFFAGGQPADNSNIFKTNSINTGSVTVSYFDGKFSPFYEGTVLSGTFIMKGVNSEGKTIQITDGRFDIGK